MKNKFSINDRVSFICKPHLGSPLKVSGKILKFNVITVGAKKVKEVAQIGELKNYPFNRSTTTIALDKLTPLTLNE